MHPHDGTYSFHTDGRQTGRHRPVTPEPEPPPAESLPSQPQTSAGLQAVNKLADRLGQAVLIVCLTYLAVHDKIPGAWVVYVGVPLVGGIELLRYLTRVRLVGVGAASGGIGLMLVCLATPQIVLPALVSVAMAVMGLRKLG